MGQLTPPAACWAMVQRAFSAVAWSRWLCWSSSWREGKTAPHAWQINSLLAITAVLLSDRLILSKVCKRGLHSVCQETWGQARRLPIVNRGDASEMWLVRKLHRLMDGDSFSWLILLDEMVRAYYSI